MSAFFICLTVAAVFIPAFIHLLIVRVGRFFREKHSRQKGTIVAGAIGLAPVILLFCLWALRCNSASIRGLVWSGIYLFAVYGLSSYVYFHLFNMSETARRVRILMEDAQKMTSEYATIIGDYTIDHQVNIRLGRLISLKELRFVENHYLIDRGILIIPARIISSLHNFIFSPPHTP